MSSQRPFRPSLDIMWAPLCTILAGLAVGLRPSRAGEGYQFNSVAVTGGGYITGIIAHPAEQYLMYTRTDIGSSYRWNQTANKWIPLTDFISQADSNLFGTEAIALDPNNVDRLYLAQGRYLTSNNSAIFVSDDRGQSFDVYPAPFPMGANELGRNNGERLAVNPFNSDELWMGTRTQGLWRSLDRAKTWANVTTIPEGFANTIGISFVIFDPQVNGTAYIGATAPQGLYYTTDGGASFQSVPNQLNDWNSTAAANASPAPLSSAPQPMKAVLANQTLYVTFADFPGPYGITAGVALKYDTQSQEWTDITPSSSNSSPPPYSPQAFPVGGYCGLSVSANDSNTLVLTSLSRDPGPALDSLYLSRDGGQTWKDVAQLSTPNASSVGGYWGHNYSEAALANGTAVPWLNFDWSQGWGGYGAPSPIYGLTKFGWWMTALLMSPWDPETVMYGTGATIWAANNILSASASDAASSWHIEAQGIEETFCLAMASPTQGAHLLSGFGDINGMRHDDLDVPQPMFGLPVFSNVDYLDWAGQNPYHVVRVGGNGLNQTEAPGCNIAAVSTDGGTEWRAFDTCIPTLNYTDHNTGVIAIDASGECLVWTSGSTPVEGTNPAINVSGPYYSADGGHNWMSPSGLDLQTPNISSDKVQSHTFYSYTNGVWYLSTDGGATYNSTLGSDIGLPSTVTGTVPVAHTSVAGYLYLSLGPDGIYKSEDFGQSWCKQTEDGVTPSLFTIGAPKPGCANPALYIWGTAGPATPVGLYRSDDNGANWVRINDDAHQYGGPTVLQGDSRVYGRLFMGTGGRGILRAELVEGISGVAPGTGGM